MPTIRYNKLVRDKIPDVIRERGDTPVTAVLSDSEYRASLMAKLLEETREYQSSEAVEELADIAEVMDALLVCHGISKAQFAKLQAAKRQARGGFDDRTLLIEVREG